MNVRLQQPWTDSNGIRHDSGESVEVDTVTLAELEDRGVVATADAGTGVPATADAGTGVPATADAGTGVVESSTAKVRGRPVSIIAARMGPGAPGRDDGAVGGGSAGGSGGTSSGGGASDGGTSGGGLTV